MTQVEVSAPQVGLRAGTVLDGGWVVASALRAGPTGVEFRCHHATDPTRHAVVKVFQDTYPDAWRRFQREGHILKRVRHPHLVRVQTAQLRANPPFLVLQRGDGPDLRTVIARRGALPLAQALAVARDLANLLTHLHAQAIYHRDLQPENVVLTDKGPLVVQLGIAPEEPYGVLTRPGTRLGDVQYAPPEWASADQAMPQQWDLYALGQTLQAMLTGEEPFAADADLPEADRAVRLTKRKRGTPFLDPGEGVPEPVRVLVRTLTDVDPDKRPGTAREVHQRLRDLCGVLGGDADLPAGPAPVLPGLEETPFPSLDAPLRPTKPPPPTLVPPAERAVSSEVVFVPTEHGDAPVAVVSGSLEGATVRVTPYLAIGLLAVAMLTGATLVMAFGMLAYMLS